MSKHPDSAVVTQMPAIGVEMSSNSKIGPVSATYVSQLTCPSSCVLRNSGCYAERGHVGRITRKLGRSPATDVHDIARYEAAQIDCLSAYSDLRLHVVGDCPDDESAQIVSAAARRYVARGEKLYGRTVKVWTYTHAWQDVSIDSWNGVSVLASVHTADDAKLALVAGYAPAIFVDGYPDGKRPFSVEASDGSDITLIPCPEKFGGKKCVDCRLCFDADRLTNAHAGIAFSPSGGTGAKHVNRFALKVV